MRHRRYNAKVPSLLAGLLRDENGHRMAPSHACKAGRRYRYYVSRPTSGYSSGSRWRLPASTVEEVVLHGIAGLLQNKLRLTDALHLGGESIQDMLSEAGCLANRICESRPAEQRAILVDVVKQVEVRRDRVSIVLRTQSLLAMLAPNEIVAEKKKTIRQCDDEFKLDIPVAFRRRGVETRLILTDGQESKANPEPKLIMAVAQGRQWFAELIEGDVQSVRDLAKRHGVDQGDVSRALPLAFLAPDIVVAILAGRQPVELTASRLKRIGDLPVSWAEQRRTLGFN